MIYGSNIIVLNEALKTELEIYVEKFRSTINPKIGNDKSSPVFVSSRNMALTHSAVANGMTTCFKRAKVFEFNPEEQFTNLRICPTRIRISIATEMCGFGEENMDQFARQYMKNRTGTTATFYVRRYANREAAAISWRVGTKFKVLREINSTSTPTQVKSKCF
ncbi:uncharacterized protein LOC124816854 [Hydra vulgaris]|uniref:uncharacterized protein LOC124816854 n=1 Tax=Hydra vulgaris TaxID=6087 RepID=UPI001F5EE139|nr:uncharacterized protein LOC124816854 [Hydra vulgaris]